MNLTSKLSPSRSSKLEQIPKNVMESLRERGHSDEAISQMTPLTIFTEHCEWHGIIGYSRHLWDVVSTLQKLG